jgi:cytochrome b6-f complex subunit 7
LSRQTGKINLIIHKGELQQMSGEMLNAAILPFSLIFVGWAIGALLLKIQGAE